MFASHIVNICDFARLSQTVGIAVFCVRTLVRPFLRNVYVLPKPWWSLTLSELSSAPRNSSRSALFRPRAHFIFWSSCRVTSFAWALIKTTPAKSAMWWCGVLDYKLGYKNPGISPKYEMLKLTMARTKWSQIPKMRCVWRMLLRR